MTYQLLYLATFGLKYANNIDKNKIMNIKRINYQLKLENNKTIQVFLSLPGCIANLVFLILIIA